MRGLLYFYLSFFLQIYYTEISFHMSNQTNFWDVQHDSVWILQLISSQPTQQLSVSSIFCRYWISRVQTPVAPAQLFSVCADDGRFLCCILYDLFDSEEQPLEFWLALWPADYYYSGPRVLPTALMFQGV